MSWGFKCTTCDSLFYEGEEGYRTVLEPHWWLEGCPMEELTFRVCPECGSEHIEEVYIEEDESEEETCDTG